MGLISLCAHICRIYRFHRWSLVQSQASLNHSQDTQVIVKNLGVNHRWSFGGSAKNHRPSDLMWSGNNVHIRRTRRPLLRGKLCSEDSVKVTGARGVEHCLWQDPHLLSMRLSSKTKLLTERDFVTISSAKTKFSCLNICLSFWKSFL